MFDTKEFVLKVQIIISVIWHKNATLFHSGWVKENQKKSRPNKYTTLILYVSKLYKSWNLKNL